MADGRLHNEKKHVAFMRYKTVKEDYLIRYRIQGRSRSVFNKGIKIKR